MKRSQSFDSMAVLYDKVRPSYPEELVDDIIRITQIKPQDRLLEIGAGTGKATVQLARRGYKVDCIEIGQSLADLLIENTKKYPTINVDVLSFEEWEPKDQRKYDLIFSAQAFHWIDKTMKYKKAYDVLKEDGYLALFWYQNSDEETEVSKEIKEMIEQLVPDFFVNDIDKATYRDNMIARKTEIIESGFFNKPEILEYTIDNKLDVHSYVQSIQTYSRFSILEESMKQQLTEGIIRIIQKHGGYVPSKIAYSLYLAKKS